MAKQLKWQLAVLCAAIMVPSALLGLPAQAQSSAAGTANITVAVMLTTESVRTVKAKIADEPRIEILLLQAQQRHEACAAEVTGLMDQAYELMFRGVEIPLGGDEAMLVVK